ncbi:MAG TPA: cysteine--tRNA ligase [Dehalococcoidia bacterium]|nr:cysteine--tRNA ligase [Dehalococcoidia bacterium]
MHSVRLYNTLTRRVEPFAPLEPPLVRMYTCGPTVYRYVHIGNLRTFLMADWLRRTLTRAGYDVRQVVNITDVGHMRQEQLDRGEDKMIAAALAEGQSPAEIAAFYTAAYKRDLEALGILPPIANPRASEHVSHMVALIERLLARGHAYIAGDTVYFDVASFPGYGALTGNLGAEGLEEAVRVQADPNKRDPRDFALWKAAEPGRALQWPSPWGPGFPGWHIECSAMSFALLGETLDLHTGGVDNIFPHHEDERAQSEAASGQPFVRHWVHGQHLLVDGVKMAKSTGNAYTLADLTARGFTPAAFRYLCLTVHYRHRMNFTFAALRGAQQALDRLVQRVQLTEPAADDAWAEPHRRAFDEALAEDMNLPAALAVTWRMLHTPGPEGAKVALLLEFDDVFGLGLGAAAQVRPAARFEQALDERETLRARRDFPAADRLRCSVEAEGLAVHDLAEGPKLTLRQPAPALGEITRAEDVPSLLDQPDAVEFTLGMVVHDAQDDLVRCVESVLRHCAGHSFEVLVFDNGSGDGSRAWLAQRAAEEPHLRYLSADHNLGEGAGRNAVLKQARGRYVVLLDTSVELTGDPLPAVRDALSSGRAGMVGGFGLRTEDHRAFDPASGEDVAALEGYFLALPRALLREVGLMDEKFRFYRNLDLDFSYQIRDRGYRLAALSGLPLHLHPHRIWHSLAEEQREALSKKNFNRFLHRWRHRDDLLRQAAASAHVQ